MVYLIIIFYECEKKKQQITMHKWILDVSKCVRLGAQIDM